MKGFLYTDEELSSSTFNDVPLKDKFIFKKKATLLNYDKGINRQLKKIHSRQSTIDVFLCKLLKTKSKTGKKQKIYLFLQKAFELIRLKQKNPIQCFISAIENCAPKEGFAVTIIRGNSISKSIDYSPLKRLAMAISILSKQIELKTKKNKKKISEIIATFLLDASNNDPKNPAIMKKNEIENIAKASR